MLLQAAPTARVVVYQIHVHVCPSIDELCRSHVVVVYRYCTTQQRSLRLGVNGLHPWHPLYPAWPSAPGLSRLFTSSASPATVAWSGEAPTVCCRHRLQPWPLDRSGSIADKFEKSLPDFFTRHCTCRSSFVDTWQKTWPITRALVHVSLLLGSTQEVNRQSSPPRNRAVRARTTSRLVTNTSTIANARNKLCHVP